MNTLRPLVLVLVGCLALAAAPAAARAHDDDNDGCRPVKGFGVGQDFGDGTTTATITRGGILNGTTAATFAITGGSPPLLEFAGTVTFTSRHGTLTVSIAGVFDVSAGTSGIFETPPAPSPVAPAASPVRPACCASSAWRTCSPARSSRRSPGRCASWRTTARRRHRGRRAASPPKLARSVLRLRGDRLRTSTGEDARGLDEPLRVGLVLVLEELARRPGLVLALAVLHEE